METFSLDVLRGTYQLRVRCIQLATPYLLMGLLFSLASPAAIGQTEFAFVNTTSKVAQYGCYEVATGVPVGAGSFSVVTPPKHGVISYGTGLSDTVISGKRIPVAIAYYTWTDEHTNTEQDDFALHWSAQTSECSRDDNVQIQKAASQKNQGQASEDCPKVCEGNPIDVGTGNKFQMETDFIAPLHTGLMLKRFYNSQTNESHSFGGGWRSNWSASLNYNQDAGEVIASRADGQMEKFLKNSQGQWQADLDVTDRLVAMIAGDQQTGWQLLTNDDNVELYSLDGRLLSINPRGGQATTLSYDTFDRLLKVTGYFGHEMAFSYDTRGNVATVTVPDGSVYKYAYGANNNLVSVTYPDRKIRQYIYENTAFLHALTGITDEKGNRFASWTYDDKGRATSSQHAGGAELTTITYATNGSATVTDALGNQHGYDFINQFDVIKPVGITGLANKNLGVKALTYDANGFVASTTDFNNNKTVFNRDSHGLEVSRTEAEGTPLARTITTQWHEKFRQPALIMEPGRETAFTYDDSGNLIQRSIGDGRQTRTWKYNYNQNGQMLSINGPRNDIDDLTQFSYDSHGNVLSIVNALGHKTNFVAYNANGRPLRIQDANGMETVLIYNQRGFLTYKSVGAETSSYLRNELGLIKHISGPIGDYFDFVYDDAHRLIKITDQSGNRIEYNLDAMGNRIKEAVYDPQAKLVKTLSQQFDSLRRPTISIGAEAQATSFTYDNNDNLLAVTDPLNNQTQFGYDELNRLSSTIDAIGNVSYNRYDDNDNLVAVTDPLGHITKYLYDGLANPVTIDSPDTGLSQNEFDVAGNHTASVDARGQRVSYSYDALNRLNRIRHSSGQAINYVYDQNSNGKGRLTQMSDAFSTNSWTYNTQGHVADQTFSSGSLNLLVRYGEAYGGLLTVIVYPSGKIVYFSKANGAINQISMDNKLLLSGIKYQAFGSPKQWLFGNGVTTVRDFDLDGRMTGYDLGGRSRQIYYDKAGRIDEYRDSDMTHDQSFAYDEVNRLLGFNAHGVQTNYSYDANSNRISLSADGSRQDYQIAEANNRLIDISQNTQLQKTYRHDAAGNLISDGHNSFIYDGRGRLIKASGSFGQEHYYINGLGQRVAKVRGSDLDLAGDADQDGILTAADLRLIVLMSKGSVPITLAADCNHDGQVTSTDATCTQIKITDMRINPAKYVLAGTYFVYDKEGHLLGEYEQSGKAIQETVWLGDMPVVVMIGDQTYYVHSDHLNAPRAILDGNGTTIWRWDSGPFGATAANEDPDKDGKTFTYNLRFPGQYYDQSTGLHYNGFRDYDPIVGRYIQSDPIGLNGGLNTFGYVGQNPLQFVDPLGLDPFGRYDIDWFDPDNERSRNYLKSLLKDPAPNDRLDVGGHGSPYGMANLEGKKQSAKEVADRIKAHPKYTKDIKIRLVSCNVGSDPFNSIGTPPFAQLVAESLETNVVEGPDFYVNIASGNTMFGIGNYRNFTGSKVSGMNAMR